MLSGAAAAATIDHDRTEGRRRAGRIAAPPASRTPSWYRYKVGDIEVTVVTRRHRPLQDGGHSRGQHEARGGGRRTLASLFMDRNEMITPYNPTVVNSGGKLYVIDPGLGEAAYASTKGLGGQLHDQSRRRRDRRRGGRRGHHHPHASRPYQRPAARGRLARISECRGADPGGGA